MANFARGMRVGIGLMSLGYGVYRLARGQRDWVTTATLTTGTSLVFPNVTDHRTTATRARLGRMAGTAGDMASHAASDMLSRAADAFI